MSKYGNIKANDVLNYDGMAKQLLDAMKDENLICFINRIFERNLSLKSKVTRLATETYDNKIKQNRCDYFVSIDDEMFLIEIQSYDDAEMAMRVFDYGIRGAKVHGKKSVKAEMIEFHMPKPVVFYLRKGRNPVAELSVKLVCSDNEACNYIAKAVYLDDYSFKDMIESYMYPMMPFYPLRYEKILLKRHTEEDETKIFNDLMCNVKLLKESLEKGIISTEDFCYICEWMVNTFRAVVAKSKKRNRFINAEEAERVMQYIVDDPIEGFNIYKALKESQDEGFKEAQTLMVKNMLENEVPEELISKYSGLDIEEITLIKNKICK